MGGHGIQTEIDINARPERVWAILVDFAAYPEWNPFIRFIQGVPKPGARLKVRMQPSGTRGMTFRPVVVAAEEPRELRWLGHLLLPGVFDGEHRFVVQPLPEGTALFKHSERFTGILVPLFRGSLDRDTQRGFQEMNRALKTRAEGH